MNRSRDSRRRAAHAVLLALLVPGLCLAQKSGEAVELVDGGPYVPTPQAVVEVMLNMAQVRADDLVYDLGSGDGRLVIEAARRHGARGVGVEHDAKLVELARRDAAAAGVADRVRFIRGDIFEVELRQATVVTLYLLPVMLVRLAPKLQAELPAGARIVSHDFPLPGWEAENSIDFESPEKEERLGNAFTRIFLYRMPQR